ncbi:hypothetical protein, unknown function [Leishmania mexicana MHOM/GT/2001/U1103]|uniref:Uncharacterized protein n=1 Tax=Leishmania mexicana (strain MHOM/GT/2001/U1103) TaxID=929439 RepID=E9B245_LEIMU|nr:hypothetical protein, unknown function [Leishmania mexicana MHOM/GT/2001/U1103]CBZ29303.1 hypothetical protein, unknown function [Leishmania mexicana MHOM/GT/2001/U1103]
MEEFTVHKRRNLKAHKWTRRILSLHPKLGVAAITDRGRSDDRFHECMRVSSVLIWPQYNKKHVKENFSSMEAMLTVRVKGIPAKIGVREKPSPTGPVRVYRYTMKGPEAEKHTWMLRFNNYEDFEKAMKLVQSMQTAEENYPVVRYAEAQRLEEGCESVTDEVEMEGLLSRPIIHGNLKDDLVPIRAQWQQIRPK